jgi:TRAP-type mannitol/chloroaromatic compound transport system permease small subunit
MILQNRKNVYNRKMANYGRITILENRNTLYNFILIIQKTA